MRKTRDDALKQEIEGRSRALRLSIAQARDSRDDDALRQGLAELGALMIAHTWLIEGADPALAKTLETAASHGDRKSLAARAAELIAALER
ncbi:hypothetical protein FJU08_09525 [Martelella alba]|uniref:Uncharacterized protein n=1 Tax=Martelella alba TaxID=2590451 RepID=A0A506UBF9_9HYPH|nr:hypothetical protein [Martelella alba]TPW30898.1 hypothetical protein FJU08_09525 [Martelella alba]